jgi:uncharacterized protein
MKLKQFFVFVTIVLTIYGSVNYYIFISGLNLISNIPYFKPIYYSLFLIFSLSFIFSFYTERRLYSYFINKIITLIGSLWLAAMLYFFLIIVISHLIIIIIRIFYPVPEFTSILKNQAVFFTIAFVFIIILIGYLNSYFPKIIKLNVHISKKVKDLKVLNIVAVSDIHLGTIIGEKRIEKLVREINNLSPDLILLVGDILSENQLSVKQKDIGRHLAMFKAVYGVYAVPGNHEYIGGFNEAYRYLTSMNIKILIDESIMINNSIILAGRDDNDKFRYTGIKRKSINDILSGKDRNFPLILMDHQPIAINESVQNGIDFQISGHTHNGQIFPLNYLVKKIYKIGHGFRKINNSYFYVSSGYGTWGPPVRIGTRSEIVNIKLFFD